MLVQCYYKVKCTKILTKRFILRIDSNISWESNIYIYIIKESEINILHEQWLLRLDKDMNKKINI